MFACGDSTVLFTCMYVCMRACVHVPVAKRRLKLDALVCLPISGISSWLWPAT